jgi:hypothetical protein
VKRFHDERQVFIEYGIREHFLLPRQHSLIHYRICIQLFGAPNGLCSSITESKHIKAVKQPYRRSSRNEPLGQMITTNQRLDKLAAARVHFASLGLPTSVQGNPLPGHRPLPTTHDPVVRPSSNSRQDDHNSEAEESESDDVGVTSLGDVRLPKRAGTFISWL